MAPHTTHFTSSLVIADIFFLHNRGTWNTFSWVTYIGYLSLGPVIAGSTSLRTGWRSFWWFNTALLILAFLMVVFLFPETKWPARIPAHVEVGHHSSVDPTSVNVKQESSTMHEHAAGNVEQETDIEDTSVKGKPSKQQWLFITPEQHSLRTLWIGFWTPWKLFVFPIVQVAALVVALTGGVGLSINFTQSQKFQAPPYDFISELVGFEAFAVFAGCLIGLFTAGPLSDWISARATKMNGGIREPEMRLPTLIPYVLLMILGNTITAVGYARNWPWEVIVIIGFTTYAVDSYRPVAGSLFVSMTVYKNLWGYGFGKFIEPWIAKSGYIPAFMLNMALLAGICLFGGIILYYKGKTVRRWSAKSSVHYM
ncbi:hypothetical protein PV11_01674 [Exophiala sideris]|uniref:Major facilitator superfamily (MFS) profile domain-containing protein n=1 Tax=Exophiala sideris TaxID=1016849 RepID=A0A0D1ZGV9_9EURO|nr:hypothetical protein PV11_01674 [Exophiala sideris]